MRRRAERGQVTGFLVVIMPALLLAIGLVYDSGEIMNAKVAATDDAQEAARAGARFIDLGAFHRTGAIVTDADAAIEGAHAYLAAEHLSGDVAVQRNAQGAQTLVVTVRRVQPLTILGLGGMWSVEVSGRGDALLLHGVTGVEP